MSGERATATMVMERRRSPWGSAGGGQVEGRWRVAGLEGSWRIAEEQLEGSWRVAGGQRESRYICETTELDS